MTAPERPALKLIEDPDATLLTDWLITELHLTVSQVGALVRLAERDPLIHRVLDMHVGDVRELLSKATTASSGTSGLFSALSPRCPQCAAQASELTRVCFSADPHVVYMCACGWQGRDPEFRRG